MMDSMNSEIKVSVCVVTYNQEKYIGDAVMSAVNQDVGFNYEILIADDASTDSTKSIITELAAKYPTLIRLIVRKNNLGPAKNIIDLYKEARGRYIAHVDGDDILSPDKILRQVEVLDSHSDVFFCTHDVNVISSEGNILRHSYRRWPEGMHTTFELLSQLPFFAHSSKMFRNNVPEDCWDRLYFDGMVDIEMHFEHSLLGCSYHLDKVLGSYRAFSGVAVEGGVINKSVVEANKRVYASAKLIFPDKKIDIQNLYGKSLTKYAFVSSYIGAYSDATRFARQSMIAGRYGWVNLFIFIWPRLFGKVISMREKFKRFF
ncbi:related to glycosyl transferase [Desulfotalea psychrophila LSv54]|uniref:Related to glycosyl transferase n=2 Tax=Desulfotalea psychrophila TaxID=84980 RepID=Q6AS96_DESPS|nr:related to glycosyl transferase [Desulfotalea psychrophila LSv54]